MWRVIIALGLIGGLGVGRAAGADLAGQAELGWNSAKIAYTRSLTVPQGVSATLGAAGLRGGTWFDPARVHTRGSYTVSVASTGHGVRSTGLYVHQVDYRVSTPLVVQACLGLVHDPLRATGRRGTGAAVLPSLGLIYRPTSRLTVSVHCQTARGDLLPYWPYGD